MLAVLVLRGPRTPGGPKTRAERVHPSASLAEVERLLERLIARDLGQRLPRGRGQERARSRRLLGGEGDVEGREPVVATPRRSPATRATTTA